MQIVTAQELRDWLEHGSVLEKDSRGPKVVLLQNGLILKIFYTRRNPWLARINPPAKRFAQNAATLEKLGIQTPEITETLWLDQAKGLSACTYQPLPGMSLETLFMERPSDMDNLIPELAGFIYRLHQQGVYFRSLHLGNVLLVPEGGLGLIDFLDLTKKRRQLNSWEVKRNLAHLRRYLHRRKISGFPMDRLIECYSATAQDVDS